ncbi:MAG: response regulator [Candidatus Woesearchaeota archaeon]|nr:response regulator [Candidatus Woesearchaeota archaeon]
MNEKMSKEKLEVLVVDDEPDWLATTTDFLEDMGYHVATASDSYKAIDQLAVRLYRKESMPDIYLCDMQDRRYIISVIGVSENPHNEVNPEDIKDVHPSMAFNLHNYLSSKGNKPEFLIGFTNFICAEDKITASRLKIPLVGKEERDNFSSIFPDINGLTREDALKKFRDNYSKYKQ